MIISEAAVGKTVSILETIFCSYILTLWGHNACSGDTADFKVTPPIHPKGHKTALLWLMLVEGGFPTLTHFQKPVKGLEAHLLLLPQDQEIPDLFQVLGPPTITVCTKMTGEKLFNHNFSHVWASFNTRIWHEQSG